MEPQRAKLPSFDADCVHAAGGPELEGLGMRTPPLSPPIFQASVFSLPDLEAVEAALEGEAGVYAYSRAANPTVAALESAMAKLESGEAAIATASGMASIAATLLGLLKPGQRLITAGTLYGVTQSLIEQDLAPLGIQVQAMRPAEIASRGLPQDARLLYAETLSNPLLELADICMLADAAQAVGARLVVDSTFATPYHCRPLELGADLVIHSATKYLGGHGDLLAGVVVGPEAIIERLRPRAIRLGASLGPLEAWLVLRGLRTLHLRMARHASNGQAAAEHLAAHPKVRAVHYPGLPDSPDHALAGRQLARGCSGMLAFDLPAGDPEAARRAISAFMAGLRMIRLAPSLADVGTTISLPALTSHRALSPEARRAAGIGDALVRLSCGLESASDIRRDLDRGLAALSE